MILTPDSRVLWRIYCCVAFTSYRSFKSRVHVPRKLQRTII